MVPAHRSSYSNQWKEVMAARERQAEADVTTKFRYDLRSRSLPPLPVGAPVRVQDPKTKLWSQSGVVVAVGQYRSYRIKFASGSVLWRNRRFLRLMVPAPIENESSEKSGSSAAEVQEATADAEEPEKEQPKREVPPAVLRRSTRARKPCVKFSI
jgi:hypothetical protein